MERTITWGLLLIVGVSVAQSVRRWWRGAQYKLEGVVSESARVIAAWRAVESLEVEPLFVDPYATALAGQRAFEMALGQAKPFELPEGESQSVPHSRRKFRVSNVGARVWWFDDRLRLALKDRGAPRQVVVLGSGMDTRPWRMSLPPGVSWFELDREDVLEAKHATLGALGAQFESDEGGPAAAAMPLHASRWTALAADLGAPGWTADLAAAGFDPAAPTVWVAEGLLMYLEPEDARGLLATLAGQSAPGSLLIAHNVTEEFLAAVDEGAVESYPPFSWDLVKTWTFGLPADPGRLLAAAGWNVKEATTRAAIAREIFGGQVSDLEGCADFETLVWSPRDRAVLFVVATKP